MEIYIELLGWAAGCIVMASGFPNILSNLTSKGPAKPSLARDIMQGFGNVLWASYGYLTESAPILALCSINAILMSVLIIQQFRANFGVQRKTT